MIGRLLDLFKRHVPWYEQYFGWILLSGVLTAVAISLSIGLMQSVWFDEAYSILLAQKPFGELLYLTSIDTHPPFYYILLKFWGSMFGWSEFALRSLSVLALGGAVAIATLMVKRLFGIRAALVALPILVLSPFLLRYGFEVRMYAVASLIGVAATYVLVLASQAKNARHQAWLYGAYAVLIAVGVYTLYYMAILWITHLVWLIWLARMQKKPVMRQRWWFALGGGALLFLPWLPTFVKQLTNGALAPISQQLNVENVVGIVSFWSLYQPAWQLNGLMTLLLLVLIVVLVIVVMRAFRNVDSKQRPYYVLFALYAGLPVLIIALISLARPMYVERYLAHTLIGVSLFVGVSLWLAGWKKRKNTRLLGVSIVAILCLGVANLASVGNYNFQRLQLPEIAQLAQSAVCGDKQGVLAADPYVAIELSYYLPKCNVHFYSEWADLRGGYAPLSHSKLRVVNPVRELQEYERLTYIYYDEPKLPMPPNLSETKQLSFGPLHASILTAE